MKHFTLKEFVKSDTARRLGIDNTPSPQVEERLRQLVDYVLDRPIKGSVWKAYLCEQWLPLPCIEPGCWRGGT